MKRFFVAAFVAFSFVLSFAQDIDVYRRDLNDNFRLPEISWQMSFDEYQILSRDLRMQHMLYAMILPGYAHFYVKDNKTGWWLFSTRMLVYASFLYTYYYAYDHRNDATINQVLLNANVLWMEAGFVMANYFYDWIHAKALLDKKKELIRYKYSMKMQLSAIQSLDGKAIPSVGVRVKF